MTFAAFLLTSLSRMHLGFNYPSDCLLTLPLSILTIAGSLVLRLCEGSFGCKECLKETCYSDSDPTFSTLTIYNFQLSNLNSTSTAIYSAVGFLIFAILTSYPVEFWRKTPYMFGNLLGIYLFFNIALCPNPSSGNKSLPDTSSKGLTGKSALQIMTYFFYAFCFASTYVINSLLGRRTGQLLSIILRSVFFLVICVQTTASLLLVRLVSDSSDINS